MPYPDESFVCVCVFFSLQHSATISLITELNKERFLIIHSVP